MLLRREGTTWLRLNNFVVYQVSKCTCICPGVFLLLICHPAVNEYLSLIVLTFDDVHGMAWHGMAKRRLILFLTSTAMLLGDLTWM